MKKITSIVLSMLLLTSQIGFAVNTHFCGGQAVKSSLSIGLHNPNCEKADKKQECKFHANSDHSESDSTKAKSCCENTHEIFQIDDLPSTQSEVLSVKPGFLMASIHTFVHPPIFSNFNEVINPHFPPPQPDIDIQVLFQSFLL